MTLPFTLPDWLPWWVPIVLLVPALLYVLAFLFMPFSVIGVKSRLEVIEARLDEIQGEIRHLALRLPEMGRAADYDEIYAPEPTEPAAADVAIDHPPADPTSLARTGRRAAARGALRSGRASRIATPSGRGPAAAGQSRGWTGQRSAIGCTGPAVRVLLTLGHRPLDRSIRCASASSR